MRDVLFRGKAKMSIDELNEIGIKHENGWVIGNLVQNGNKPLIVGDLIEINDEYLVHEWWVEVVPESVGQYTGLKGKNGKEIYEGDIVKGHWWKKGNTHRHIGRVTYVMNAFKVRGVKQYLGMDDELNPTYEIIGNIYENLELLEVSE